MKRQRAGSNPGQRVKERNAKYTTRPLDQDQPSDPRPDARTETEVERISGTVGLTVIIAPLMVYFHERTQADDLDTLAFSLHHLFCHFDALHCDALPAVTSASAPILGGQLPPGDLSCLQQIWTRLYKIKRILERMEPLCMLLNRSSEGILDDLDSTSTPPAPAGGTTAGLAYASRQYQPQTADQAQWEQAYTILTESLGRWQERHRGLTPFAIQFTHANATPSTPSFALFDATFATILEIASAIFGDILLSFRAIPDHDDEAAATLIFDLVQQSDQLLNILRNSHDALCQLVEEFAIV